jgi:hypothetical protein
MPTRRDLLKSVAATLTAWLLPHRLFATPHAHRFHFIKIDPNHSWPVSDPVAWALKNQGQPILERAAEGLAKLTVNYRNRVVRLIVRRCDLKLLELRPDLVVVHHWGHHQADLRPFFKTHRLARPEIVVELRDRKKETITTMTGDSFLYGFQIAADFPLDLFQGKFGNRFTKEADDWQVAPGTWSGFAWANTEDGRIPWAALKSAWRQAASGVCQNCDGETVLVNFGLPWSGMLSRTPRFEHVCPTCLRVFRDETVKDVKAWMATHLDRDVQPGFEMVWGRRVRRVTV